MDNAAAAVDHVTVAKGLGGRCANCGRSLRDVDEPRRQGKHWFCSQSCFLQAESSGGGTKWKPRRRWRRRVGWTVGIVVVLFIGLIVLGAIVGTKKTTPKANQVNSAVVVSHRTSAPVRGSAADPIHVGTVAPIGASWQMRVVSVIWNVSQKALGLGSEPLPPGAENVVVKIAIRYTGGGSGNSQAVVDSMNAVGAHKAVYRANGICLGNAEFGDGGISVYSEQTATGTACFEIAANDAATLRLFVYRPYLGIATPGPRTWFGLR